MPLTDQLCCLIEINERYLIKINPENFKTSILGDIVSNPQNHILASCGCPYHLIELSFSANCRFYFPDQ